MNIPIPIVCGTTGRAQIIGLNGSCPVCRGRGCVNLVDRYQRFCFCFVPLCKIGRDNIYGECQQCGSTLPASVAMNSAGYTHVLAGGDHGLSHRSRHGPSGPSVTTSSNSEGELTPIGGNDDQRLIPHGVR